MARIQLKLKIGDILREPGDVLVLKHAQGRFGLDLAVDSILEAAGRTLSLPKPGDFFLTGSVPEIAAPHIIFIGVPPLRGFGYKEIRAFARRALSTLAEQLHQTRHVLLTVHGPGYGLDEIEAFQSELAGLADAVQFGESPAGLQEITIIEIDPKRVERLTAALDNLLPDHTITSATEPEFKSSNGSEKLRTAGFAAEAKPNVFVAMPFEEEMDDIYHYGIVRATNAAGFLCERADLSIFTGDVMEWVKSRIRTASLVVADLTDAHPNVYLEIGYAWGSGIPTVLVAKGSDHLKFDVRGQRCLIYKKIKELEDSLTRELKSLPKRI